MPVDIDFEARTTRKLQAGSKSNPNPSPHPPSTYISSCESGEEMIVSASSSSDIQVINRAGSVEKSWSLPRSYQIASTPFVVGTCEDSSRTVIVMLGGKGNQVDMYAWKFDDSFDKAKQLSIPKEKKNSYQILPLNYSNSCLVVYKSGKILIISVEDLTIKNTVDLKYSVMKCHSYHSVEEEIDYVYAVGSGNSKSFAKFAFEDHNLKHIGSTNLLNATVTATSIHQVSKDNVLVGVLSKEKGLIVKNITFGENSVTSGDCTSLDIAIDYSKGDLFFIGNNHIVARVGEDLRCFELKFGSCVALLNHECLKEVSSILVLNNTEAVVFAKSTHIEIAPVHITKSTLASCLRAKNRLPVISSPKNAADAISKLTRKLDDKHKMKSKESTNFTNLTCQSPRMVCVLIDEIYQNNRTWLDTNLSSLIKNHTITSYVLENSVHLLPYLFSKKDVENIILILTLTRNLSEKIMLNLLVFVMNNNDALFDEHFTSNRQEWAFPFQQSHGCASELQESSKHLLMRLILNRPFCQDTLSKAFSRLSSDQVSQLLGMLQFWIKCNRSFSESELADIFPKTVDGIKPLTLDMISRLLDCAIDSHLTSILITSSLQKQMLEIAESIKSEIFFCNDADTLHVLIDNLSLASKKKKKNSSGPYSIEIANWW